jgi:hypothetical protein
LITGIVFALKYPLSRDQFRQVVDELEHKRELARKGVS